MAAALSIKVSSSKGHLHRVLSNNNIPTISSSRDGSNSHSNSHKAMGGREEGAE